MKISQDYKNLRPQKLGAIWYSWCVLVLLHKQGSHYKTDIFDH